MRRLCYSVAMSLDGFIAGPKGEYDWITPDSGIDFAAIYGKFDTLLMGRRTYEVASTRRNMLDGTGMKIAVASTTLDAAQHRGVTVLSSGISKAISKLKAEPGKDIWLMGGGVLFRSLLDAGLVDSVDVSVFPVVLGSGVPLVPEGRRRSLHLTDCRALPSGVVMLSYSVALESSSDKKPTPKKRKPK